MGYNCLLNSGITAQCDDLRKVGGVDKRFWIFNIDGLDDSQGVEGYSIQNATGYVTALNFNAYGGLHLFTAKRESHSGGSSAVIQAGSNKFYKHEVTAKLFNTAPWDNVVIQDLLVATVGIILETQNETFKIFGPFNGMDCVEQTQNTGLVNASDVSMNLKWEGSEKILPMLFFTTDYKTSLNLLRSYEV